MQYGYIQKKTLCQVPLAAHKFLIADRVLVSLPGRISIALTIPICHNTRPTEACHLEMSFSIIIQPVFLLCLIGTRVAIVGGWRQVVRAICCLCWIMHLPSLGGIEKHITSMHSIGMRPYVHMCSFCLCFQLGTWDIVYLRWSWRI